MHIHLIKYSNITFEELNTVTKYFKNVIICSLCVWDIKCSSLINFFTFVNLRGVNYNRKLFPPLSLLSLALSMEGVALSFFNLYSYQSVREMQ